MKWLCNGIEGPCILASSYRLSYLVTKCFASIAYKLLVMFLASNEINGCIQSLDWTGGLDSVFFFVCFSF